MPLRSIWSVAKKAYIGKINIEDRVFIRRVKGRKGVHAGIIAMGEILVHSLFALEVPNPKNAHYYSSFPEKSND
jgi:hypothetical protein